MVHAAVRFTNNWFPILRSADEAGRDMVVEYQIHMDPQDAVAHADAWATTINDLLGRSVGDAAHAQALVLTVRNLLDLFCINEAQANSLVDDANGAKRRAYLDALLRAHKRITELARLVTANEATLELARDPRWPTITNHILRQSVA